LRNKATYQTKQIWEALIMSLMTSPNSVGPTDIDNIAGSVGRKFGTLNWRRTADDIANVNLSSRSVKKVIGHQVLRKKRVHT